MHSKPEMLAPERACSQATAMPAMLMLLFLFFAPTYIVATLPFKDQCLKWHNEYRLKHQVEAVVWDDTVAQHAATWATYLADNNLFQHATNLEALGEGENLYRSGKPIPTEPCTEATKLFYDEVKDYDYNSPGFASNTGHFTQVVWKNTQKIGAAVKTREDGFLVVVIRYSPRGNYLSQFAQNVFPPIQVLPSTTSLHSTALNNTVPVATAHAPPTAGWQPPTKPTGGAGTQGRSCFAFDAFVLALGTAFKSYV